jgi:hypothetical protein
MTASFRKPSNRAPALFSPQRHIAAAANALSPAADARILRSAATDAIRAGSDQAGALILT